jgi:hypothetical protein
MWTQVQFKKAETPDAEKQAKMVMEKVNYRWPGAACMYGEKADSIDESWTTLITDKTINDKQGFKDWMIKNFGELSWRNGDPEE